MLRWQPTAAATSTARRPSAKSRRASNRLDCAIRFPIQLLTHELMAAWTPTWCNDRLKPPTSRVVICTQNASSAFGQGCSQRTLEQPRCGSQATLWRLTVLELRPAALSRVYRLLIGGRRAASCLI